MLPCVNAKNPDMEDLIRVWIFSYGKIATARTGEPDAFSQCGKAIEIKAPEAGT